MSPILYKPPIGTVPPKPKQYGRYCIKARAKVIAKNGKDYVDITGFDTSMDIVNRVEKAVKKKAHHHGMVHTEVQMFFVNGTYNIADGTIYANYLDSGHVITFPPSSFL